MTESPPTQSTPKLALFATILLVWMLGIAFVACGPEKTTTEPTQEQTKADASVKPEPTPTEPTQTDAAPTEKAPDTQPTEQDNPDGGNDNEFIDLTITSLAATAQDKAFGKSEQFYVNHPITIRLSAQTNDVVTEPVSLGIYLVQKRTGNDTTIDKQVTCFLGTITFALFPEANKDINKVKQFTIPEDCLLAEDGSKLDKETFNIAIDPQIGTRKSITKEEKQAGLIIFGDGWAEQGVANCKNVDPLRSDFGCVEEFTIERPKDGNQLDFVLNDFQVDSPVMVLINRTQHPDATKEEQYQADININLIYEMRGAPTGSDGKHAPVTLHYEVCAYKAYDCSQDSSWWPLSVYQRTTTSANASVSTLLLKNSVPNSEEVRSYGLFATGDTLKNIKSVKDFRYILRATINRGDAQTSAVGELPTHALNEDNDNNFLEKEIMIVIPSNAPTESPTTGKYYAFERSHEVTKGSKKYIGLSEGYKTEHRLSTLGISSETEVFNKLVGWFTWSLFEAGYKLQALPEQGIPGAFQAEIKVLGKTLWEHSIGQTKFEYEVAKALGKPLKFEDSVESKKRYWAKIIPIDIIFKVTLELGLEIKAELESKFEKKDKEAYHKGVLSLTGTVKPFTKMEASLSGYANLWRIRGGINATLVILNLELPIVVTLSQEKFVDGKMSSTGSVDIGVLIEYLKGSIDIRLEKCSGWWSCKWKVWKKYPLFNFTGAKYEASILKRQKTWTFTPPPTP